MRQSEQFKRIPAVLAACVLFATTLVVVIARPGPAGAAPDELSGRVFNDVNNNGIDDAEPPVAGVTVTAYDAVGAVAGSATTNALGLYSITGLTPGENYRVEFTTLPAGWTEGPIGPDSDTSVAFAAPETTNLNFGTHEPVLCDEQIPSNALLLTYNAAVSCSAVVDPALPKDGFSLFDITNAVPASGRQDVTSATPVFHHPDWHIDQLGNIFGVAVDNRRGDFYGAASSNYSHEFYSNAGTGNVPAIVQYGNIGGGAQDLGAAGTVYQMDAVTGAPTVFVQLPQQSTTVVHQDCENNTTVSRTTGVGLGNIVYDSTNDQMFAANWEDGHIYRIDMNGNILDAYDPDATDDGTPGFANGQVPYALELSDDGTRLYWGTVFGLEVWSVDLTAGGFMGTTSSSGGTTIYENDPSETLNQTIVVPTAGEPDPTWLNNNLLHFVSDLELLPNGDMLAGLRVGCNGSPHGAYNHQGQTHTLTDGGSGIFGGNAGPLDVSATGDAGLDDNYGGVAYSELADGSIEYAVTSADILDEAGPHGLAVFEDADAAAAPITPLGAIDYGTPNDPKGIAGDVEILNIHECTPTPIEIGNYVWLDLDQDGIQDPDELPLVDVTVTLYAAEGVTVLATTTTDANGQYVFTEADGVIPNASYEVGFDASTTTTTLPGGASPSDLAETTPNATGGGTGGAGDDFRDSDVVGGRIAVTTGDPGDNDHTLDAGYTVDGTYDLALIKVYTSDDFGGAADGVIAVGSNVTFTITVENQGTIDATTFTVTDYIPAGFVLNDGAWTDNGDGTANFVGGPLVAGDDVDISITLTAVSAGDGEHVNWAEISADDGDDADSTPNTDPDDDAQPVGPGDPTDNEINNAAGDEDDHDPAAVTIGSAYDLALLKVYTSDDFGGAADGVIAVGSNVTFTITVENQGTIDATTFTVTDYIPAGFSLNDGAWADNGDGTANFVGGPLVAGGDVDIPITLTADSASTGDHVNWAEISADDGDDVDSTPNADPDDDNQPAAPGDPTDDEVGNASGDEDDHDPAGVTVGGTYDLALIKVYTSDTVGNPTDGVIATGANVTFTITVENQGTIDATTFTVTDYLPAGFVLNDAAWTDNGDGTASFVGGPLVAGGDVDIPITLTAVSAVDGEHVNWAEISADDGDDADSTPNTDPDDDAQPVGPGDPTDNEINNAAGDEDDHDPAGVTLASFDLALTKVVVSDTSPDGNAADGVIGLGDDVTFAITVINQGTVDATSFSIVDYVPAGFVLNDSDWIDNGDGTASYTGGILAAGASASIDITMTAVSAAFGEAANWAEISSDSGDDLDSTPNTDPDDDNQPDAAGDPTDDEVDNGPDANGDPDEDDHDVASVTVLPQFDLALRKTLSASTNQPVVPGQKVTFDITIFNQGSTSATDISIVDYLGAGWEAFDLGDNPAGLTSGDQSLPYSWAGGATPIATITGSLAPGQQLTVPVTVTIPVSRSQTALSNTAEIAAATPTMPDGTPIPGLDDVDSVPDQTNDEDPVNDVIDNIGNDEDDHDIETVTPAIFDLALRKRFANGANTATVRAGDLITFELTVFNQGNVDATDISLVDYPPAGLTLSDPDWSTNAAGNPIISLPGVVLGPGQSTSVDITFRVGSSVSGQVSNQAEITGATPIDVAGVVLRQADGTQLLDIDSVADAIDTETPVDDEIGNANGDEDDHDVAVLSVTRQSTFIAFTGVTSAVVFLSGLLIMLAGAGMTLFVRDRRRAAEVRV